MRMAGMQGGPKRMGSNLSGGRIFSGNPASMGDSPPSQFRTASQVNEASSEEGMIRSGDSGMTHLATPGTVQTGGMVKQAVSAGSGAIFTSPGFYSPYHTASSWQIPTVRREVYKWCLHPDTFVTMSDFSQCRIDELEIRNSILTSDGTSGKVSVISRRPYSGKMISIKARGFSWRLKTTPDHILYRVKENQLACERMNERFNFCREKQHCGIKNCNRWESLSDNIQIEEVRSDELKVGDFLYCPTNVLTGQREDFSPEMMRLFGLHLADGTMTFSKKYKVPSSIRLTFGSKF